MFLIIIAVLICIIIVLLLINSEHRKTLKSKKLYEQMMERMESERKMIKEDRVKLRVGNKELIDEKNLLKSRVDQYWEQSVKIMDESEKLANKYIRCRIELLKMTRPDLKESPAELYQMQDLLDKKKKGDMNLFEFLKQVDVVFDTLSKN